MTAPVDRTRQDTAGRLAEVLTQADWTPQEADEIAHMLLPVVGAIAADEIEQLAEQRLWVTQHDTEVVSALDLYERVAQLRGELEPVTYDFPPEPVDDEPSS